MSVSLAAKRQPLVETLETMQLVVESVYAAVDRSTLLGLPQKKLCDEVDVPDALEKQLILGVNLRPFNSLGTCFIVYNESVTLPELLGAVMFMFPFIADPCGKELFALAAPENTSHGHSHLLHECLCRDDEDDAQMLRLSFLLHGALSNDVDRHRETQYTRAPLAMSDEQPTAQQSCLIEGGTGYLDRSQRRPRWRALFRLAVAHGRDPTLQIGLLLVVVGHGACVLRVRGLCRCDMSAFARY